MASLHGARAHRLLDRGAIAPGYVADLVLLDDLRVVPVSLRAQGRARAVVSRRPCRPTLRDTMRSVPVAFAIPGTPERVRVIDIQPGQLITGAGAARAARSRTATSSPTRRATWPRSP